MKNGLNWIKEKAQQTKEYDECYEYSFNGKIPYRMAMEIIQKNKWDSVYENKNVWNVSNPNMGISYNLKTGILSYSNYVAK